jgi:LysM repeat protein
MVGPEQVFLQVDPNLRPTIIDTQVTEDIPRPTDAAPALEVVEETATPEATAVPTTAPEVTAVPTATVEKIIRIEYTVQQGDTLYSIAERIDTTIALMAEYDIAQGNIVPGQQISLPIGNPAYCTGKGRPYAVREGDTAYSISQRFNTTISNLQTLNSLDANYTVNVADIICVP